MTALHDMTAGELLANYKAKKLSPVEAVGAVIAHIETWEPKLKALYAPDFEGARKAAKSSETLWPFSYTQQRSHETLSDREFSLTL
jgi:aspartyl-tRNA(Asn)/glutamyl-tRNA(Gln) amidotransferase subunit A